jgi:hypothetical protein
MDQDNTNYLSYILEVGNQKQVLWGSNQVSADLCFFWRYQGKFFSLPFPASRVYHITLTSDFLALSLSLTLLTLSAFKDFCHYIGPFLAKKKLDLFTPVKSLLPFKKFQRLGHRHL